MKLILSLLGLLFAFASFSQVAPDYYAIKFTDKDNNEYSLDVPDEFLTQRSIDRRTNQGIVYDMTDLPITEDYVAQVAEIGVEVKRRVKWINTILVKTTNESLIDEILALEFVESATKIANEKTFPFVKPKNFFEVEKNTQTPNTINDANKSTSSLNYGQAFAQINLINGIPLHDMGYQGQGMVIAVLDGGFIGVPERKVFDSLYANNQILGSRDFASEDNDAFSGSSHGTAVLSTMAANWPGQMIGTAPKADYWLLKTEYTPSEFVIEEYNWLVGAAFADSVGADLINSSLSYTVFDDPEMDHSWDDLDGNSTIVTKGADLAAKKGILVVNSAGNEGNSSWQYIGSPADGDSVFAIGAVNTSGQIAGFSSRGYPLDPRIKPNICAIGSGTTVADAYDDYITTSSGTSFSSPTIAGMTACLWQANPGFNNQQIMNALQLSSSQSTNPDRDYGYGIPDYEAAMGIVRAREVEKPGNSFAIYPNPATDQIFLSNIENESKLRLLDMNGRLINEYQESLNQISVISLIPGVYILQLINETGVSTQKFIKK